MGKTPNILIIMCDQLNASVMSCYGGPVKVPNIERLVRDGVIFDKAYCETPFCSPSRASVITGLYPHGHGLVGNVMRLDYPVCHAPVTEEGMTNVDVTTEKILHDTGYKTAHYGKWHLLGELLYYYPDMYREHYEYKDDVAALFAETEKLERDSYMDWYGWKLPVDVPDIVKECTGRLSDRWKNLDKLSDFYMKMGRLKMRPEDTFDYKIADRCIDFINRQDGRPFMLTCSFNLPHDPNVIPSPYYEMVDAGSIDCDVNRFCDSYFEKELSREVAVQMGEGFLREFLRIYYASVMFIDDQVGRVLGALEKKGLIDSTVILFVSDHGDMAGGHGMFWKSTSSFYDEVSRVPLIIRYPLALKSCRYGYPVELIDIMPTLLELTGREIPQGIHGESLIPYIKGGKDGSGKVALSERISWNEKHVRKLDDSSEGAFMMRTTKWKYFVYPDGKEFLFDMEADPHEYNNLAEGDTHTGIMEELRTALKKRLVDTGCNLFK